MPAGPNDERCPFVPGEVYQRKMPGVSGRPSFRVLDVRRQRLGSVTQREVLTEGLHTGRRALERWRLDWVRRHDRWWKTHRTASDEAMLERWRMSHAPRDCWVLTFALLEAPRLLPAQREVLVEVARRGAAASSGHVSGDGDEYTSGRTIDREAEAVDPDTLARIVAGELGARAEAATSRAERRRMRRRRLFERNT